MGTLADGAVDHDGPLLVAQRIDVGLDGDQHARRRLRMLSEDGLAADDDDVLDVRDLRTGSNQVLELLPAHAITARR